jgi:membrane-associated phospholipid phosphatase
MAAALALCVRWSAVVPACRVPLSEVYLGVHYAADMVAGAALGMAVGFLIVSGARRTLGWRTGRTAVRPDAFGR